MKQAKRNILVLVALTALLVVAAPAAGLLYLTSAEKVDEPTVATKEAHTPSRDRNLFEKLKYIAKDHDALKDVSVTYVDGHNEEWVAGLHASVIDHETDSAKHPFITVNKGYAQDEELRILAHEYMHVVWTRFGNVANYPRDYRETLGKELYRLYETDAYMQERVRVYAANDRLDANELLAFYCTESSDAYISQAILDVCNNYIRRDRLTFVR